MPILRISIFFMLCFVVLLATGANAKRTYDYDIAPELLEEYSTLVHEYVQNTRRWNANEYLIKFRYIDNERKEVVFSIVNLKDKQEYINNLPPEVRQGKVIRFGWLPLEFNVFIKIPLMKVTHDEWVRRKEFLPLHPEFNIPEYPPFLERQ